MKKITRILAMIMCVVTIVSNMGMITTHAAGAENTGKGKATIKVYNSKGVLLEELESEEELQKYFSQSGERSVKTKIIEIIWDVIKGYIVDYVKKEIDDAWTYLNEYKITVPKIEAGEIATVYSLDGNIYNPYPPHSYQGATWVNTNFIVVVTSEE